MIDFEKNLYGATEPLSNFDIDRTVTTLTLVRRGDLSYTTVVRYVIYGDPASFQSPSDPLQEIVFHPHESTKELEIVLQANYDKNTVSHESLIIQLVEGWVRWLGNISVPARLGVFNQTVITIIHRDYSGPFFPDLPMVANVGDSLVHTPLFYDLPLHCITVSDLIIIIMIISFLVIVLYATPAAMLEPLFGREGETQHHLAGLRCTKHHPGNYCVFMGSLQRRDQFHSLRVRHCADQYPQ